MEYSNAMNNVYNNINDYKQKRKINDYKQKRKRKILIVLMT